MPDASQQNDIPGNWSDAFLAMPQEAPPTDLWRAVSQRVEARGRRRRVPAWLGVAAAAGLVAISLWPRAPVEPMQRRPQPTPIAQSHPVEATEVAIESQDEATPVAASAAPTPVPVAAAAAPAGEGRPSIVGATEVATPEPAIGQLYTESAQLEALLAVARDERVGSASAMLLADAFDAQVASIDASLTDPGIDDARRDRLWEARVDTLRQAAGFIGTQRLLAAQGQGDALLVSVD